MGDGSHGGVEIEVLSDWIYKKQARISHEADIAALQKGSFVVVDWLVVVEKKAHKSH